jgi:hypothetical protein
MTTSLADNSESNTPCPVKDESFPIISPARPADFLARRPAGTFDTQHRAFNLPLSRTLRLRVGKNGGKGLGERRLKPQRRDQPSEAKLLEEAPSTATNRLDLTDLAHLRFSTVGIGMTARATWRWQKASSPGAGRRQLHRAKDHPRSKFGASATGQMASRLAEQDSG